jgi:YidC/Oxa1 family membrane protein insertase
MKTLWYTVIYEPIYNALIFIAQHITLKDVGLAVVLVTVLIRLVMMPLSRKMMLSQYKMKALEPKLAAIKAKGLSKEAEAQETFALYKTEKINPASGCLYMLIQIPILLALYFVFNNGVTQPDHLYSSLNTEGLKNMFLGFIDITKPYLPLAILAGLTQAIQAFLQPKPNLAGVKEESFQGQFAKSMSVQTKFVLPIIIAFIATKLAAAVALYWVITNIFSIAQELYFRNSLSKA